MLSHNKKIISQILSKKKKSVFLILDRINDPHNLGACLRTANAANVDCVISSYHHSTKITNTVKNVSCGAYKLIPIIFTKSLYQIIQFLKKNNVWIYSASSNTTKISKSIYNIKFHYPISIVIGSESQGIRKIIQNISDEIIFIPTFGVKVLNLSVASGIILFEMLRQSL